MNASWTPKERIKLRISRTLIESHAFLRPPPLGAEGLTLEELRTSVPQASDPGGDRQR
ncbi:MAG: hypothetical protein IPI07_11660 [Flavobacteriales bacterium]|nr:hypothetical protein [Flavobacteriales bacterium]